MEEMEGEVRDLRFINKFKDKVIEQLHEARERDARKLNLFSRKIGQLSNRLVQLGAAKEEVDNVSSLDDDHERSLVE